MNTSDGRFYYQVAVSSEKGYGSSSIQQIVQNLVLLYYVAFQEVMQEISWPL